MNVEIVHLEATIGEEIVDFTEYCRSLIARKVFNFGEDEFRLFKQSSSPTERIEFKALKIKFQDLDWPGQRLIKANGFDRYLSVDIIAVGMNNLG